MSIFRSEEFGWRNCGYAELHDQKPRQLKVSRPLGNMGRELVVFWELHLGHVDKDEISAFRIGILRGVSGGRPRAEGGEEGRGRGEMEDEGTRRGRRREEEGKEEGRVAGGYERVQ